MSLRASHPLFFALCALFVVLACGGGDEQASLGPADVAGEWAGTTSQGKAVLFTILPAGLDETTFTYVLQGTKCFYTSTLRIPTDDPIVIQKSHFAIPQTQLGQQLFIYGTGDFTSSTAATGTIRVEDGLCGDTLSLTWTAQRAQ